MSFDPKDPSEIVPLTFDFSALVSKLASAVVSCTVESGTPDPAPAALLVGNPVIRGALAIQRVQGGQVGTLYRFTCTADDLEGGRFVLLATLYVRNARVNDH